MTLHGNRDGTREALDHNLACVAVSRCVRVCSTILLASLLIKIILILVLRNIDLLIYTEEF